MLVDQPLDIIFDPPLPAPEPERPFRPFREAYLSGPVPPHLKDDSAARLVVRLAGVPEEEAAALVAFGSFWLDDRPCLDPEEKLATHRTFRFNPPVYGPLKFYEADPGRIVYQDDDLLVYNKESGRPCQGVPHDAYNNALSAVGRLLKAEGRKSALWLPHRLDADTSGLLLMARNKEAASFLGRAFQEGRVDKEYLCLGLGRRPEKEDFFVDAPIAKEGGRYLVRPGGPGLKSRTAFKTLGSEAFPAEPDVQKVLFQASPLTGRTHQIRLHLAWAGWPIAGDRFYGRRDVESLQAARRLMLASAALGFAHPGSGRMLKIKIPAFP